MPYTDRATQKKYQHQHYLRNKGLYLERTRARRDRLKKVAYEVCGSSCKVCGEDEPCVLEFHHTDPSAKTDNITTMAREYTADEFMAELKKCVTLCANCHLKVHVGVVVL